MRRCVFSPDIPPEAPGPNHGVGDSLRAEVEAKVDRAKTERNATRWNSDDHCTGISMDRVINGRTDGTTEERNNGGRKVAFIRVLQTEPETDGRMTDIHDG